MKFVHLYTGPDGKAHFRDVEVVFKETKRGTKRSEVMKVSGLEFTITDPDRSLDWHTARHRQFVITLEGETEIVASDGTKRTFGPGDIMLADDVTGQGHISRTINNRPRKAIMVTLE